MPETVLITGVSRGIGAALLVHFAKAGWRVHGTTRSQDETLLASLGDERKQVVLHSCNLANWAEVNALAASIAEPLDVLINNAATFANHAYYAKDFDPAEMLHAFAVNVVGPTLLAARLKSLLDRGSKKLIVMTSTGNASLAGNTTGEMLAYRASKSALNQVVRTMAAEWAGDGYTIVALNPGWVQTDMGGLSAPTTPAEAAKQIFDFVTTADPRHNGAFVNSDASALPW